LKIGARSYFLTAAVCAIPLIIATSKVAAQDAHFHNAPPSSVQLKNPYAGQHAAAVAGARLYNTNCGSCHGIGGRGTGNIPALSEGPTQTASDGEVFWFITTGSANNGMPAWGSLSEQKRWQIVTYLKSLKNSPSAQKADSVSANTKPVKTNAPPPQPPYTDFRFEEPGKIRKITAQDLPAPYSSDSAGNAPKVVPRPQGAWPKAPAGFSVQQYATGLDNPRLIRTAPNGDVFLAESSSGKVRVFRGVTREGKPEQTSVFATGLNQPYGGGHWTRDVQFTADGKKMFVAVGSSSNVDDPDTTPDEKNRADILEFNPDGSEMRVYAYGIRNAGGGLAIDPETGDLWCSVNERDGLGDNLVPDYITQVEAGGFYGWPWWYIGGHQDPRHEGKHPELKDKVLVPDVLLQPHNASLEMTFYEGTQFPAEYRGDIFSSQHGSWNRSLRAGYEVIRVPRHQTSRASGEYEDFVTGFVIDNSRVWGRPVGITVAQDGSLLITDDGSNSVWRISYASSDSQQSERGQNHAGAVAKSTFN
jgi:glucose/arabinose dehydrogenase/mono/diheme cytochrome c family protein